MAGQAVDYKAVLADLKGKRAALDQAIAAIEVIVGESASSEDSGSGVSLLNSAPASGEILPDSFAGMTIAEAATEYLRMFGRPARSTESIADALERGGIQRMVRSSVGTTLRRVHAANGDIVQVGRGMWGLADWYPRRPTPRGRRQADDQSEPGESEERSG